MKLPRVGQQVWADGHYGVFAVVRVRESEGIADLELTTRPHSIKTNISFSAIRPIRQDTEGRSSKRESLP